MIYKLDDKIIILGFFDEFEKFWKFCKILFFELGCYLYVVSKFLYWFLFIWFYECVVVLFVKMLII